MSDKQDSAYKAGKKFRKEGRPITENPYLWASNRLQVLSGFFEKGWNEQDKLIKECKK